MRAVGDFVPLVPLNGAGLAVCIAHALEQVGRSCIRLVSTRAGPSVHSTVRVKRLLGSAPRQIAHVRFATHAYGYAQSEPGSISSQCRERMPNSTRAIFVGIRLDGLQPVRELPPSDQERGPS